MEGRGALLHDVELNPPHEVYPHGPFLAYGHGVIGELFIGEMICTGIMWTVLKEKCGTFNPQQALMLTTPVPGYGRVEMRGAVITSWTSVSSPVSGYGRVEMQGVVSASWASAAAAHDIVRITNLNMKMAELLDHA